MYLGILKHNFKELDMKNNGNNYIALDYIKVKISRIFWAAIPPLDEKIIDLQNHTFYDEHFQNMIQNSFPVLLTQILMLYISTVVEKQ